MSNRKQTTDSQEIIKALVGHRKTLALYIASVVRNAMEPFHVQHLSDEQMRELNPIIRNAIFTALQAAGVCHRSPKAAFFVRFSLGCIPQCWESPTLLRDYVALPSRAGSPRRAPHTTPLAGKRTRTHETRSARGVCPDCDAVPSSLFRVMDVS